MSRHPIAATCASILNVFALGTGHVVIGKTARFLKPLFAYLLFVVFAGVTGIAATVPGFVALFIGAIALMFFAIGDGWLQGLRHGFPDRRWYLSVAYLLLWSLAVLAFVFAWVALRDPMLDYANYRIESTGTSRFLQPGDIVLVSTRPSRNSQWGQDQFVVAADSMNQQLVVGQIVGVRKDGTYLAKTSTARPLDNTEPLVLIPKENIVGAITGVVWPLDRMQVGMPKMPPNNPLDRTRAR